MARSRYTKLQTVLWLALAVGGVGCRRTDPGQLIVVLRTDMSIPDELDEVQVETFAANGERVERRVFMLGRGDARYLLPASFGLAPVDGDVRRHVHLRVTARVGGLDRFDTERETLFVPGEVRRLDVFLARRCVTAVSCPDDYTCGRHGCIPIEVDPETLPTYEEGDETRFDAGPDAGDAGPDAGDAGDGGPDAGDAGPDAGDAGDAGPDAGDAGDGGFDAGGGPFPVVVVPQPARTCTTDGECGADFTCLAQHGGPRICRRDCASNADCDFASGSACDRSGHCSHPCDPLTNDGCPAGSSCGVYSTYTRPDFIEYLHLTVCRGETPGAAIDAMCDDSELMGQDDCAGDQYCVSGGCRTFCTTMPDSCSTSCFAFGGSSGHPLIVDGEGAIGFCFL